MKRSRKMRRRRAARALLPAAIATMTVAAGATFGVAGGAAAPQAETAKLKSSKGKVRTGAKVKLRGQFPPRTQTQPEPAPLAGEAQTSPAAGGSRKVRIQFKPAGEKRWRKAKTTVTDRDGRWIEKVKVKRSGRFRALHADGRTSGSKRVRVKAKLRSKVGDKHAKVGERVPVKGQVIPRGTRRKVVVRIGGDKLKTRTQKNGRFKVKWKARGVGSYKAKVTAKGNKAAAGSKDKAGKTTVYRPAQASWYGPGFYGNRTACGQTLTTSTQGVAHKTMPCGTKLKLRHGNNTVTVRVIDRGPYHGNREFDLTGATKQKLGFGSTGTVWASK